MPTGIKRKTWAQPDPSTLKARDRWWERTPEGALWYTNDAANQELGSMWYLDIPIKDYEKYRVSSLEKNPNIHGELEGLKPWLYSRAKDDELFLPPEYTDRSKWKRVPIRNKGLQKKAMPFS